MTAKIALTTDAASMFLSWLEHPEEGLLGRLLEHPGYRAVQGAIDYVERNRSGIIDLVAGSLARLFAKDVAFPVGMHCVVGYDWGIGLHGKAAVNLGSRLYLDDLREIGYMLVHESTHVAYERAHGPMNPQGLEQPGGLRHLVHTLVQNEGLAVYPGEEAAGRIFDRLSRERLSYVVGCSAFVNLERKGGLALVREAALWTPEEWSDLSQIR